MVTNLRKKYIYIVICLVTFVFYGNTIVNEYALDDAIAVKENTFTKKGIEGIDDILTHGTFTGFFGKEKDLVSGGRYRPLSLITLAVEYEVFGLNPHVSHLVNILLYAFVGILVFVVIARLMPYTLSDRWYLSLPFIVTLLYIGHPVHTEAVANIKGRDEILAMTGSLLALWFILQAIDKQRYIYYLYAGIAFFLGLMSKENTVTFLGVIPLAVYIFRKIRFKRICFTMLPLIIAFIAFFIIRQSVLGQVLQSPPSELMNNPFLHASVAEKYATIAYTLFLYLKLLIFPHPLTFDYYPYHIPILDWGDPRAVLPAILYAGLFLWLLGYIGVQLMSRLRGKAGNKGGIVVFSVFYYLITLSIFTNIVFPVGTFMNERFLFMPSLGFTLLMGYLLHSLMRRVFSESWKQKAVLGSVLIIIMGLYGFKTITRNRIWKNDFTLFTHDVRISSESAKSNCSAGGKLIERAQQLEDEDKKETYTKRSIRYLRKAVDIHPTYKDALLLLGNAYTYNQNYDSALYYYKKILKSNPGYDVAYQNLRQLLNGLDSTDFKIQTYKELLEINPKRFEVNYKLGNLYGKEKGKPRKALPYLKRAVKLRPNSKKALKDLGVAYGMMGQFSKAIRTFEKAIQQDPDDPQLYLNMSVTYHKMGEQNKAVAYRRKAKKLKQQNAKN